MRVSFRTYQIPKAGSTMEQIEDACDINQRKRRIALADGASDGFDSNRWARNLTKAFVDSPPTMNSRGILRWLEHPIKIWMEGIQWGKLPWYSVEKAKRGAFSTLLGIQFHLPRFQKNQKSPFFIWCAQALGDTCLFHVRGGNVITCFPVEKATEFNNAPPLLSTRPDYNQFSIKGIQVKRGVCYPGDLFLLASDALAFWILECIETGNKLWRIVQSIDEIEFNALINDLRANRKMRNDDVTLIAIKVDNRSAGKEKRGCHKYQLSMKAQED